MKKKIIHVLANDGSPLNISEQSIYGLDGRTGLGGAELFLLTLCRAWHDAGHKVVLYNDPTTPDGSVFEQKPIDSFIPHEKRDVVIIFRSPNERLTPLTKGQKVWLSCDQTTVGNFADFASKVDKIVTISPNHAQFFKETYNITDTITIDIPVRDWEYEGVDVERVPYRCIFNSIPSRGVEPLRVAWARIVSECPQASLVITSDWRLWTPFATEKQIQRYKVLYADLPNVTYLGAVNRKDLIKHELKAQLHLYPCTYDELFCISVAETQVAGAYPITSTCGALKTTNMGTQILGDVDSIEWNKKFTTTVVEYLNDQERLQRDALAVQKKAKERFGLKRILEIWEKEVFND